ncbi:MAG TPA: hypothetical protein VJN88_17410 [Ktedonobacterales bacterium]|nr:hypothetical protein [Ktedonobacterales bacterium]
MNDVSDAQPERDIPAEDGKRRTWPAGVPPMRLNRRVARRTPSAGESASYDSTPPRHLRLTRAVVGLALLTVAWVGLLLVFVVGQTVWTRLRSQRPLSFHLSMYALSLAATCWVGVVAAACIVAGAFSLALALTRRGW